MGELRIMEKIIECLLNHGKMKLDELRNCVIRNAKIYVTNFEFLTLIYRLARLGYIEIHIREYSDYRNRIRKIERIIELKQQ